MRNNYILVASGITKIFRQESERLEVLRGIDLKIREGEFVMIFGPSGAGKSTLLHIIGLLDTATSGDISFKDQKITNLSESVKSWMRNKNFGFVFQTYHLLPEFNLYQNVILPALVHKNNNDYTKRALQLIKRLKLDHRLYHDVTKLSGGEMQRACIARALINNPDIILCDEPTGNLDTKNATEIWELLRALNKEENKTIIVVTHDERALQYCDRSIKIENGVIINE